MKLSHDSFLRMSKTPLERTGSFLFYGNSEFWIQSKINLLLKNNPSLQQIKPRILSQELFFENKNLFSSVFFTNDFFTGPELIIIRQATDKITSLIEDIHSESLPFFILSAKDYLKPSSKLRKFYETHHQFYSVPCYDLSAVELEKEINSFFLHHQKKISHDLTREIGKFFYTSPDTLKNELEKILSYLGSKETVEPNDVKSSISLSVQPDIMNLVDAFLDLNKKKTFFYLNTLEDTGSFISILRALGAALIRIHSVKQAMALGHSFETSIKTLSPPLLFTEQEQFRKRVLLWPQTEIEAILQRIPEVEIALKSDGKFARETFEFFFLKILF